jgi:hypothetical protein
LFATHGVEVIETSLWKSPRIWYLSVDIDGGHFENRRINSLSTLEVVALDETFACVASDMLLGAVGLLILVRDSVHW